MAQLKLSSFYGNVPRPYLLLKEDGKPVEDRVDPPKVNDALLEWAAKVPVSHGGTMTKPVWDGPPVPAEPRTDFQIFFQERFDDIHAANPALFASDRRAMLSAASVYWRETLTPEQRLAYRERAAAERAAAAAAVAAAEEADPKYRSFRERLQNYKRSMGGILAAAKASAGPLWRAQRRLNRYRALEEREAEAAGGGGGDGKAPRGGRGGGRKKAASARKQAAARERLVSSDDSSEEDEEEEEEAAAAMAAADAADAAAAMRKLLLATARKGGRPAAGKAGAKGRAPCAAPADEEAAGGDSEGVPDSPPQQQQGGNRTRSGAAALASRLGSKGRGAMYEDVFELPPSRGSTPAKPRSAAARARAAAADPPAASPGKRTRGLRASAAAPAAEESPAKKPRRSGRK